jgi:hypothetical protein
MFVCVKVCRDHVAGHPPSSTHLHALLLGPGPNGLRLSRWRSVGCHFGCAFSRCPWPALSGWRASGGLAGGSLTRGSWSSRLRGGHFRCSPLACGGRGLGPLRRTLPHLRGIPLPARSGPVARFPCRSPTRLRLAGQTVAPIGTAKNAQGVLKVVFPGINGDAHEAHSVAVDAPDSDPSHHANLTAGDD